MKELKTLKDLDIGGVCFDCSNYNDNDINYELTEQANMDIIKKEAIKWVKFCDEEAPEDWDSEKLREFWLQRFNISEEDLNHDKIQKGGKSQ